jgi:putative flippase GtrA
MGGGRWDLLGEQWHRIFTEAYRFLAVGGVATLVAFLIFNFLVHGFNTGHPALLDDEPYLAYVVANLIGMVISYRGSRTWVFRDRPPRTPDGGRLMFVAINLVTMLIPMACLWFSRNVVGVDDPWSDNLSANVIGLFLGLVARFCLFRSLVFRRPVHLPDLVHNPLQVFELSELSEIDPFGELDLSEPPRDPSTSGRARPPGP